MLDMQTHPLLSWHVLAFAHPYDIICMLRGTIGLEHRAADGCWRD